MNLLRTQLKLARQRTSTNQSKRDIDVLLSQKGERFRSLAQYRALDETCSPVYSTVSVSLCGVLRQRVRLSKLYDLCMLRTSQHVHEQVVRLVYVASQHVHEQVERPVSVASQHMHEQVERPVSVASQHMHERVVRPVSCFVTARA